MKKLLATISILTFSASVLTGCIQKEKTSEETEKESTEEEAIIINEVEAGTFAQWEEDEITYAPSVPEYEIDIPLLEESRVGNVTIYENLYLDNAKREKLNENGFVVNGDYGYSEFFDLYETNRYDLKASFITTDSILHTYHLYFNYLLKTLEETELFDTAVTLSDQMVKTSEEQYETAKGTNFEDAALRNLAYFSVAKKILQPDSEISSLVKEKVEAEIKLIEKHAGVTFSNIMGAEGSYKEDYSQYVPRGHYTTEPLKKYFNALMWYGRITFTLKTPDETKSALLMISALQNDKDSFANWEKLYEPINFFVGEPDDLSFYEYKTVAGKIFGEDLSVNSLTGDEEKITKFIEEANKLNDPKINSMPILAPTVEENDRTEETKGFRFLGQRSTVDAMIFQKLIYRDTEENSEGDVRMLPNALDIPATMGSEEAYEILENLGETDYKYYKENMEKLQNFLKEMPQENWTKNLYWGWVNTLNTLLKEYGEGYPTFMKNKAWKLKELTTFLGSWTELKHDTILYAKQVYAEMGGAPTPENIDDRGYVEPNPELYNKLKSLIGLTMDGLETRDLLNSGTKEQLQKLETMAETLRDISIKELENKSLTDEEYEFIRSYGGSLEHFWSETLTEEEKAMDQRAFLNTHPSAVIADVATNPNCCVLEEGTGDIKEIYVVFPIEEELHVAKGGIFSHYEFSWPMDDRLTDEKWRKILFPFESYDEEPIDTDFIPEIAPWQKEFTTFSQY
jgi:hypothetical protein